MKSGGVIALVLGFGIVLVAAAAAASSREKPKPGYVPIGDAKLAARARHLMETEVVPGIESRANYPQWTSFVDRYGPEATHCTFGAFVSKQSGVGELYMLEGSC